MNGDSEKIIELLESINKHLENLTEGPGFFGIGIGKNLITSVKNLTQ